MIVMKFGGTSVQDAAALRNASQIVMKNLTRRPLVVLSACAGVTTELLSMAEEAASGSATGSRLRISELRRRHGMIALELFGVSGSHDCIERFREDEEALKRIIDGIAVLGEIPPRILDQVASYGELWSTFLFAKLLGEHGVPAKWLDIRQVMTTDDNFSQASPLLDTVKEKAQEVVKPSAEGGLTVITQGYIGATRDGRTTTLGRGGSDYSAAILGAALGAEEIQIWTDVDGILTADPSIIEAARPIERMSFLEASELAYFGARVLHPSTILPAIKSNIPVRVLNSKKPASVGTLIQNNGTNGQNGVVKSITYKEGITVVTVQSTRMLLAHGFLARVFAIFERYKKSIDVVATSEVGISITVDRNDHIEAIASELQEFAEVRVEQGKAVVCVVGEGMKRTKGIAGRVFCTLGDADVNVELISHGGSDINLTFVIDESQIELAVEKLHSEFFQHSGSQHARRPSAEKHPSP
ncbi:MAG: lysine-sensitive aspartokinase 3 [Ignavibacteriales bacterium]|nr:lysine-sensitive aspartokinase 3 [Ignavibacteriales bacterium]